jgi:antitoxin HicB
MVTTTNRTEDQARALLARPYRRVVQGTAEDGYLAFVPEWPGCVTAGETPAEALALLEDAMTEWAAARIAAGQAIPAPSPMPGEEQTAGYSGQFRLRVPKSLHRDLAEQAEHDGISLNSLVLAALARELGRRENASVRPRSSVKSGGAGRVYVVRPGDTLSGIAQRELGDASRWPELFALNRQELSTYDQVTEALFDQLTEALSPGRVLRLPPASGESSGDTAAHESEPREEPRQKSGS